MITLFAVRLTALLAINTAQAAPMSLDDYLRQVQVKDPGSKAATINQDAQRLKKDEADLQTTVRVEGQASHMDDRRPTLMPSFMGTRTTNTSYSLGLAQQSTIGLRWKLSGNLSKTKLYGVTLPPGTDSSYQDFYPTLELEIPLWRNLFGSETRAQVKQVALNLKAASTQADIQNLSRRNEAEMAYWQLANTQEKVRLLKENISRTQKILSWNQSRVKNNLADRSDLYQAQAMHKVRELDLVAGELELEQAQRQFNQMLGVDLNAPVENLNFIEVNEKSLQSLISKNRKSRLDIEVTKQQLAAAQQGTILGRERLRPTVNLFGTSSLYGRDTTYSRAYDESMDGTYPYTVFGVKLIASLDALSTFDVIKGYRMEEKSLELQLTQKRKDSDREWDNYQAQLSNVSAQLRLVRGLEVVQKQKVDNERNRLRTGRTVTYQVLMFEQDYANTQAQRLALELKARQLIANMNLFAEESL